jgi:nitronate monooxygenase
MRTPLAERIGIDHAIVQAPMAGGATTPELVRAVSNAGALGVIGAAYLSADQIAEISGAVRSGTSRPFGINLFSPVEHDPLPSDTQPALDAIAGYHREAGLPAAQIPSRTIQPFEEQFGAALESGATVFSFTFGLLPPETVNAAKARNMFVIGTATSVDEAIALERAGCDAVVAQGSEAGAHRGSFGKSATFEAAMIGTMALVPQIVDALRIPVVASGGIMDGRGVAAALALGAGAVQMGTAFLTTTESGIPEGYKAAVLAARETDTRITRAFSGRPARGIANRFMNEVEAHGSEANLGYPTQNALTRPLRTEAARSNRPEFLSLWAGQGLRLARRESAAALVSRLVEEANRVVASLTAIGAR